MPENRSAIIREKTAKLERVKAKVQDFVDRGGDLKSTEALPLGLEMVQAYDDLAKEFGEGILKPIKPA